MDVQLLVALWAQEEPQEAVREEPEASMTAGG